MKRILSLIIALGATAVGLPLLWVGGSLVMMSTTRTFGAEVDLAGTALGLLGLVLVAAATATVAFSSLGVIVTGAIHVVAGLALLLVPSPTSGMGGQLMPLMVEFFTWIRFLPMDFTTGWVLYVSTGAGLLVGVIQLVCGLMARRRRARSAVAGAVIAAIAGAVAGLAGLGVVYFTGEENYRQAFAMLRWDPLIGATLLLGILLVAVAFVSTRWTSIAAYVVGAVALIVGLLGLAAPMLLIDIVHSPVGVSSAFIVFAPIGGVALAAGIAGWIRGRRNERPVAAAPAGPAAPLWYPGPQGQYPSQGHPMQQGQYPSQGYPAQQVHPQGQQPAQPGYPPQGYPQQQGPNPPQAHPGQQGQPSAQAGYPPQPGPQHGSGQQGDPGFEGDPPPQEGERP